MGIEIPDFGADGGDDDLDVGDDELLNELELLEGGAGGSRPKRANPPPPPKKKSLTFGLNEYESIDDI